MRISIAPFLTLALAAFATAKKHHRKHGHDKHHNKHQNKHHAHSSPALQERSHNQIQRDSGHEMGIPWGCDPACIKGLKSTRQTDITFYHHWQDGKVSELDKLGLEYVPTFWGPTKYDKWNAVKNELKKGPLPKYMLAFNEPDVQGQSDLGPKAAAKLWMKELKPFADRGVQVGAPQVCWNMQWLQQFMEECKKLGCNISFIPLHWYGSWRDFDKFTKWISSVHQAFHLDIWLTEYGITQASGGSQADIKNFHMKAVEWMRQQGYVKRSAWLGGFQINQKPDPYPSTLNSYFNGDGSARDLLVWASHSGGGSAVLSFDGISKRDVDATNETEKLLEEKKRESHDEPIPNSELEQYDEEHCDYKCQLRVNSIEKHHRKKSGFVHLDDKQVCVATPAKLEKDERIKLATCLKQVGILANHKVKAKAAS
ncbi:uncharacterized protein MEPE_05363 [Melanopsichium pennsylvanicum]|uniref:Asl1-like glycosyl hydrolase catalytic domain-containing protein n=2 Tax=Melanopsichium pennsylvanicum TaxID=63383 RepID=A0AAJ5C7L9_9BASI|nr:uncharacterized protein BN887_03997 [Melanopsichium pennsylvanicum 4]SNX86654.1 uncharacterized protein MEPE_05363 [Melanopsichium pennsylvanicum]